MQDDVTPNKPGDRVEPQGQEPLPASEPVPSSSTPEVPLEPAAPAAAASEPAGQAGMVRGSSGRFPAISKFSAATMLVIACLFAGIGVYYLVQSHAAPSPAPVQAQDRPTYQVAVPAQDYAADSLLLKFNAGVPQTMQDKLIARYGKVSKDLPQIGVKEITVPPEALDAVINALSHNPAVAFAEKNRIVVAQTVTPNDPLWSTEWGPMKTQTNQAWDTSTGMNTIVVADLDTGVSGVADLAGKLTAGYDFVNNDNDPSDDNGHGTMTAGIIGALSNNGVGVASYCWGCMIMPVKVMGANGTGDLGTVAQGITYAADHGAKIINMSLGGPSDSSTLDSAVKYASSKGASLYAAAGNSGSNTPQYPAATPGVIGVAATDSNDIFYSWSNYGSWVKLSAPGTNYTTTTQGTYGSFAGTSAATPAVAGAAGIVWAARPAATAAQVEQALENAADPVTNVYRDSSTGQNITRSGTAVQYGRVNTYKAVQALLGLSAAPADTTPPVASITAPANGATVAGQASVGVTATDNVGVTKVELYKNGILYATATTAPYSFYWDTTTGANGSYTLTAKAYDAAGNAGGSAGVTITVANSAADTTAPDVSISSPANGSSVGSKAAIKASATDNVGVTEMDVYIDGVLKSTATSGSISYSWNTRKVVAGTHTITVKAYDAAGNAGQSSVTVTK